LITSNYNAVDWVEEELAYPTDYFREFNFIGNVLCYETITDLPGKRVGLRIRGDGILTLLGWESNTFTGDVIVDRSALSLQKRNGAIAVQGDIYVKSGHLTLDIGNQIAKSSTVSLEYSRFAFFNLDHSGASTVQFLHNLIVKGGSVIDFSPDRYHQALYLDDLLINEDSLLRMRNWSAGSTFLLVRKDSEHLADALSKIKFTHIAGGGVAKLREYNDEYWEVFATVPEPSTYGAVLGGVGLGLVFWRRRRKGRRPRRD